VRGEETLGLAAVAAPGGRVDEESHKSILPLCEDGLGWLRMRRRAISGGRGRRR
jgi:hypothetical protein